MLIRPRKIPRLARNLPVTGNADYVEVMREVERRTFPVGMYEAQAQYLRELYENGQLLDMVMKQNAALRKARRLEQVKEGQWKPQ